MTGKLLKSIWKINNELESDIKRNIFFPLRCYFSTDGDRFHASTESTKLSLSGQSQERSYRRSPFCLAEIYVIEFNSENLLEGSQEERGKFPPDYTLGATSYTIIEKNTYKFIYFMP